MKKTDIALIVGVVLIVIIGGFVMKGNKDLGYELPLALSGKAGLQELTYSEYKSKIDNNESFVFIVERATCSHCVNFMPVAEEFAKDEGVPLYYVDTDKFEDDEWAEFESTNTFFRKHANNWGTPTVMVLAGSNAVKYIEGETTAKELKKLYTNYFDLDNYSGE